MRVMAWMVVGCVVLALGAVGAWAQDGREKPRKSGEAAPLPIVPRGPVRPLGPDDGGKLLPPDVPPPQAKPATYTGESLRLPSSPKVGPYRMSLMRQISQTLGRGESAGEYWQSLTLAGRLVVAPPAAGGRADRTFRCERVAHLVGAPADRRRYDSADPAERQDPSLAALWAPMRGWQGTRTVTADGRTHELRGLASLARASRGGASSPANQELLRWAGGSVLDELGVGWWGQLLVGDPVSPGSRWETILYLPTEPPLGVVKVPTHCLLQDIVTEGKRRLAQIDFAGSCAIMARRVEPRWVAGAPDMQIRRLQLAVTGRLQLDLACGLPASLVLNLRGRAITVVGGPQSPRVGVPGEFVSERELAVAPATEAAPPAGKKAVSGS